MSDVAQPPVAWTEIPVRDLEAGMAFYGAVTGNTLTKMEMGPNVTAILAGHDGAAGGHLYVGHPSEAGKGPTAHLTCAGAVEEAMERVKAAGGQVVSPVVDIPSGRFAYAIDPDGNSIGLFELKAA